jgi:hypothetical protein
MKKLNLILLIVFVAISIIGCQSPEQKEINAQEKLDKAKSDADKASQDSAIKAQKDSSNEFFSLRKIWEKQINENYKKIAELKADAAKDKKKGTPERIKSLNDLDQKNSYFKDRIRNYKYDDSDWVQFKKDAIQEMNDIVNTIKSLK